MRNSVSVKTSKKRRALISPAKRQAKATNPLLNLKELAVNMGVSYFYARGMKKAGLPLQGGRITRKAADQWLSEHPDFRPSESWQLAKIGGVESGAVA